MDSIRRALTALHSWRTPDAIRRAMEEGPEAADAEWELLPRLIRERLAADADVLSDAGVSVWLIGDGDYPLSLTSLKAPPPVLFHRGNPTLLREGVVGVCGSRAASPEGLDAARALARHVAAQGKAIVAGNAVGVDAEAQGAALAAGGGIITVLPEGISHFRLRTGTALSEDSEAQLLVISQFSPRQPWSVGGAMTRNSLIAAIADVLVVIEAAEAGGTLAAGETALRMGRPVIALEFGTSTPPGNTILIRRGAKAAKTPRELSERLREVEGADRPFVGEPAKQLPLTL